MDKSKIKRYLNQKLISVVFLSIMVLLFTSCNHRYEKELPVGTEVPMGRNTYSFHMDQHPFDLFPNYRIQAGDVLDLLFQIRTWEKKDTFQFGMEHVIKVNFVHTPELNEEQKVRPNGMITLPYIGDVYVLGKTVDELTQELNARYCRILRIPGVYITVPDFRGAINALKQDLHTAPRGLSRLVTVRPDGYVTFPLVGDVFVFNRTIPEVNQFLDKRYDEIISGLHCDLFLETHSGSVIYVLGHVNRPGAYKIPRPVTLFEALSLAEGATRGAQLSSIIVVRKYGDKLVATRVDLKDNLAFKEESKLFFLTANDIVYVPKTWVTNTAEVARDVGDIIFFRGWGISTPSISWSK